MLAEALGKTLGEIRQMGNSEYVEWQAFFKWRQAVTEFELAKQRKNR